MDNTINTGCYQQQTCFYVCGHVQIVTAHNGECYSNNSIDKCLASGIPQWNQREALYKRDICPWCTSGSNVYEYNIRRSDHKTETLPRALVLLRQKVWLEEENEQLDKILKDETEKVMDRFTEGLVSALLARYTEEEVNHILLSSRNSGPSQDTETANKYKPPEDLHPYSNPFGNEPANFPSTIQSTLNTIGTIRNTSCALTPFNSPNTPEEHNVHSFLEKWGNLPDPEERASDWVDNPFLGDWRDVNDIPPSPEVASIIDDAVSEFRFGTSCNDSDNFPKCGVGCFPCSSVYSQDIQETSEDYEEDDEDEEPAAVLEAVYDGFNGCFPTTLDRSWAQTEAFYKQNKSKLQEESAPKVGLRVRLTTSGRNGSPARVVRLNSNKAPTQKQGEAYHNGPAVVLEPLYNADGSVDLGIRVRTGLHHFGDDESQDWVLL